MRLIVAAYLLLISSIAVASDLIPSIPSQFLGEWNARPANCGTGWNESSLRIKKNQITFYESQGPVKAVVSDGRYEVALILELSGEGYTSLETSHFKLSPGADKLTEIDNPAGFVRYRCPGK